MNHEAESLNPLLERQNSRFLVIAEMTKNRIHPRGLLVIVEVKRDNKIDNPLVQVKREAAKKFAYENDMTYRIIRGSEVSQGIYPAYWIK
jgi:hypothetical protein